MSYKRGSPWKMTQNKSSNICRTKVFFYLFNLCINNILKKSENPSKMLKKRNKLPIDNEYDLI